MSVLCVGEILWDVFENERETLAGAPLNVAVALKRLGNHAALISAVGPDARGERALRRIRSLGFNAEFVKIIQGSFTGVADIRIDSLGNPSYSIARPAAFDQLLLDGDDLLKIIALPPQWIYFGTLAQTSRQNEEFLISLTQRFPSISCFYDLNLRAGHWNLPLVQRLARHATVLKLNQAEAREWFALESSGDFSLDRFCRIWSSMYAIGVICITLGSKGCAVFSKGKMSFNSGFPATIVDTVGAGDAFTAGILHGLLHNWSLSQTARFANALGSIVASRATAIPDWTIEDVRTLLNPSDHA